MYKFKVVANYAALLIGVQALITRKINKKTNALSIRLYEEYANVANYLFC